MAVQVDVRCLQCGKGRVFPAPFRFFSLYVRVRQVGAWKRGGIDRLVLLGVFCENCILSGRTPLPTNLALVSLATGADGARTTLS